MRFNIGSLCVHAKCRDRASSIDKLKRKLRLRDSNGAIVDEVISIQLISNDNRPKQNRFPSEEE